MLLTALSAYTFLVLINIVTFGAFALDKHRARNDASRVPEANLLGLAVSGGWLGAKLGQKVFRHKSRKEPFSELLNVVPLFHAVMITATLVALITLT